jgi:hypothetical protein
MSKKIELFKSVWREKPLFRVYLILIILIPIPLILVSVSIFFRLPAIKKVTHQMKSSVWFLEEIENTKSTYTESKMQRAWTDWENVRNNIPDSFEEVSDRISDIIQTISSRGFKMSYKLGELKSAYHGASDLSVLPLSVKMKRQGSDANQTGSVPIGIVQFIDLLREIDSIYYGIDLAGLLVTGIGDGIKTMNVDFNLWVAFGSEET